MKIDPVNNVWWDTIASRGTDIWENFHYDTGSYYNPVSLVELAHTVISSNYLNIPISFCI